MVFISTFICIPWEQHETKDVKRHGARMCRLRPRRWPIASVGMGAWRLFYRPWASRVTQPHYWPCAGSKMALSTTRSLVHIRLDQIGILFFSGCRSDSPQATDIASPSTKATSELQNNVTFSPEIETTAVRTGASGVRAAVEWTAPRGLILSIVQPKYILF